LLTTITLTLCCVSLPPISFSIASIRGDVFGVVPRTGGLWHRLRHIGWARLLKGSEAALALRRVSMGRWAMCHRLAGHPGGSVDANVMRKSAYPHHPQRSDRCEDDLFRNIARSCLRRIRLSCRQPAARRSFRKLVQRTALCAQHRVATSTSGRAECLRRDR
jgi:hypothetical protein